MVDLTKWKKVRETSHKLGWRSYTEKIFIDPAGKVQSYITWNTPGEQGAGVIALTKDNKVIVVEQFRQNAERIVMDIPGGVADEGESLASAATRELFEETGYATESSPEYLGGVYNDSYNNFQCHYFLVRDCYQKVEPEVLADEYVNVRLIESTQLIRIAKAGEMNNGVAVLMAYDKLLGLQEGT